MIGKIQRVKLREVWKHEAYDFTQYLQDNLDLINGATDLKLVSAEREQAAGSFNVDLVAEDESGNTVVIENQLEKSDHDHLGKLLTYLAAFQAKAAVWIVQDARPEHVAAIAWLSESTSASFYLLKVEAVRIVTSEGESDPAPIMTLLVGPSAEAQSIGKQKMEIAGRTTLRMSFWTGLLARAKSKTKLHSNLTPNDGTWNGITASPGKSFIALNYVIGTGSTRVEIYIDRGYSGDDNEAMYDQLYLHKAEIEEACQTELSWERLEGKRACRVSWRLDGGGYKSPESEWAAIQERLIDTMIIFERALAPHLKALKVPPVPTSTEPQDDESDDV